MRIELKNITRYLNLLIVEDDLEIQENLKNSLDILFKNIYTAKNGLEALECYKNNEIDIIISDYVMPKMDAYEFIKILREEDNNVPVILLSSFMDMEKLQKCIPLNLVHFLEKPISFDKLLEQINISVNKLENINSFYYKLSKDVQYDRKRKLLIVLNKEIDLTTYESKLFELLCMNKKDVVEFDSIVNYLSSDKEQIDKTTIKNIVYRLRKKIPLDIIESHRNLGYSINL